MRLVDSHAHIQADRFDRDRTEVLAAARAAGVERMLVPGWDIASSRDAIELARSEGVHASAGIHPHVADSIDDPAWAEIDSLARDPRVVALGETGLDYDRAFSSREAQLDGLRRHIALAIELGRPVIVHCRSARGTGDAHDDIIRELANAPSAVPIIHSYSGPVDYAERLLERGAVFSFSGLVFRPGEEASATVAQLVPDDRLLVETDSPYLSPPGAPKRRNEPRWVEITARWVAMQRHVTAANLGGLLTANYDRIFTVAGRMGR